MLSEKPALARIAVVPLSYCTWKVSAIQRGVQGCAYSTHVVDQLAQLVKRPLGVLMVQPGV